jgi:hypothetical protein
MIFAQLEYFQRINGGANSKNNYGRSSSSSASSPSTKQYLESPVERDDRRSIYAFLGVSEFWMAKLSGGIVVQIKFLRASTGRSRSSTRGQI